MNESVSQSSIAEHLQMVVDAIIEGELVFFLGAGVNLCDRSGDKTWKHGEFLPDGSELAQILAEEFHYPPDYPSDLTRVSQYVDTMLGSARLYKKLRQLLDVDYPLTSAHKFLATLPKILRDKGCERANQLIVTTNYDDLLERAFKQEEQEFDLVFYMTEAVYRGKLMRRLLNGDLALIEEYVDLRGKFMHQLPSGDLVVIDRPNEYVFLSLEQRPIILKIHGAIDRNNMEKDSFVITEDHYIDYLSRANNSSFVPVSLNNVLQNSHFLFWGYSLRDWNLRVFLHRLWGEQRLKHTSWAIQLRPNELDKEFWLKRDVKIKELQLCEYISELEKWLRVVPQYRRPS
ncbi:MAG: hypothetical protein DKINENOH_01674 [bacterium]|nr:hypothetical protein [bacterium]